MNFQIWWSGQVLGRQTIFRAPFLVPSPCGVSSTILNRDAQIPKDVAEGYCYFQVQHQVTNVMGCLPAGVQLQPPVSPLLMLCHLPITVGFLSNIGTHMWVVFNVDGLCPTTHHFSHVLLNSSGMHWQMLGAVYGHHYGIISCALYGRSQLLCLHLLTMLL